MHRIPTILGAIALFLGSTALGLLAAQTIWSDTAEPAAPSTQAVAADEIPTADPVATERPPAQPVDTAPAEPARTAPAEATTATPEPEPAPAVPETGPSDHEIVVQFVAEFDAAHRAQDLTYLLDSIHPSIPRAFGMSECRAYIEATAGSITDMTVISVGERTTYRLPSPDGAVVFEDAIPVEASWTVAHSGEVQSFTFHLAPAAGRGGFGWLTQCGVTVTSA